MQEGVEDELVKKALGMILTELRYGQKVYISYTGLDGLERGEIVELHWFNSIKRCSEKKLVLSRRFPFLKYEIIYYTDVVLNTGTDTYPNWKHIYALESPAAIARKFGIEYNDTTIELIQDQLEHGNK